MSDLNPAKSSSHHNEKENDENDQHNDEQVEVVEQGHEQNYEGRKFQINGIFCLKNKK